MLFICASFAAATQQEMYAITLYQRIYDEFPDHAFRPVALLQQALVYDNLHDADHSKPLYEQFLVMFPDHPLAEDAQMLLEMAGKSDEEWEAMIQQFENQNQIEE
jgi:TolA-binding protein